jgi:hypothetical protein
MQAELRRKILQASKSYSKTPEWPVNLKLSCPMKHAVNWFFFFFFLRGCCKLNCCWRYAGTFSFSFQRSQSQHLNRMICYFTFTLPGTTITLCHCNCGLERSSLDTRTWSDLISAGERSERAPWNSSVLTAAEPLLSSAVVSTACADMEDADPAKKTRCWRSNSRPPARAPCRPRRSPCSHAWRIQPASPHLWRCCARSSAGWGPGHAEVDGAAWRRGTLALLRKYMER